MPVRKFKDVSEMEGNTWRQPGDPELARAIRGTWDFARRTLEPRFPPGVHKHRSAEEAEREYRKVLAEWNTRQYEYRTESERELLGQFQRMRGRNSNNKAQKGRLQNGVHF